MMSSCSLLLVIPPLTQLNTPYPSTAYLTGFLRAQGYEVYQADVGLDMVGALFSRRGLDRMFDGVRAYAGDLPGEARQMLSLERAYCETIEPVMALLRGEDASLTARICQGDFLPQGPRAQAHAQDVDVVRHRGVDQQDVAKQLATWYLEDLADLLQATIAPHFALSRYAESVTADAASFDRILDALAAHASLTDELMLEEFWSHVERVDPGVVGFSVPFPGNLYGAFRLADALKHRRPDTPVVLGGGYVNTELRRVSDRRVFDLVDYITLDDGERPLQCLMEYVAGERQVQNLCRTWARSGDRVEWRDGDQGGDVAQADLPAPTYDGLRVERYLTILDTTNPRHRLWSDGHWNKLTVAHGCYWKQCTFCDIGLDYIARYEASPSERLVDRIEALIQETGHRGFHFVDEAAPPAGLKGLALSLLQRGVVTAWWGNIRFERAFTPDLCRLLAASGCIAVTAGLEAASDRLLQLVKKGVTVDQVARVAAAFREAGILVHAYLMYGLPGQSVGETVESLERVRQLFAHDVIQSAFWHRCVVTVHSPLGRFPEQYGIHVTESQFQGFAENNVGDADAQVPEWLSEGLRCAVENFKEGRGLENDVRRWFAEAVPAPGVARDWVDRVLEHVETEGADEMERQFVWTGGTPVREPGPSQDDRVILPHRAADAELQLPSHEAEWLVALIHRAMPTADRPADGYPTYKEVRASYPYGGTSGFDAFAESEAFATIREAGLLLV